VDAQRALVLAGISKSERPVIGLERPDGLDPRDGKLLDGLRHGSKHAIAALLDQFTKDLFVLCLFGVREVT
jgi:hypothetical protein